MSKERRDDIYSDSRHRPHSSQDSREERRKHHRLESDYRKGWGVEEYDDEDTVFGAEAEQVGDSSSEDAD